MVDPEPLGSSHVDLEVGYFVLGRVGTEQPLAATGSGGGGCYWPKPRPA